VSVGNLSMGGRGKTPIVAHIARLLLDAGERPAILSRGYGRRTVEDGVVVVSDGTHLLADVDRAGDEPLMLARALHGAGVFVCDQRAMAGALAERHFGATVHVLDDGFQHVSLARDVEIVVIAPEDLDDRPVPFGRLRQPVSALNAAHAVIVDDGTTLTAAEPQRYAAVVAALPSHALRFSLRRTLGHVRSLDADRPWPPQDTGSVVALAGIARPERFTAALRAAGWQVAREVTFRDHHRYIAADLSRLSSEVTSAGAIGVLTTEKDAERLLPWRPFPVPIAAVPLEVSIEPADAFRSWLLDRIREAHA
jgi:tetraacyldisaccharide 4'-kinase